MSVPKIYITNRKFSESWNFWLSDISSIISFLLIDIRTLVLHGKCTAGAKWEDDTQRSHDTEDFDVCGLLTYFLILSFRRILYVICFFGQFHGVWVLIADVSEPSICSIFLGRWMKYDRVRDVWCIYTWQGSGRLVEEPMEGEWPDVGG